MTHGTRKSIINTNMAQSEIDRSKLLSFWGEIFEAMDLKTDSSWQVEKTRTLGDGTEIRAEKSKERIDKFNVSLVKDKKEVASFSFNEFGLTHFRINSLRTSLGGMTLEWKDLRLTKSDLSGKQKLQEAEAVLIGWISQMIKEDKYVDLPLQAKAEFE